MCDCLKQFEVSKPLQYSTVRLFCLLSRARCFERVRQVCRTMSHSQSEIVILWGRSSAGIGGHDNNPGCELTYGLSLK